MHSLDKMGRFCCQTFDDLKPNNTEVLKKLNEDKTIAVPLVCQGTLCRVSRGESKVE